MRVRLAVALAAKIEGIRLGLGYSCLSDTANLLLDAVQGRITLNVDQQAHIGTIEEPRVRISERHRAWLSHFGTERGINGAAVVNLVLSEYLNPGLKKTGLLPAHRPTVEVPQPTVELVPIVAPQPTEETRPKPKGASMLKGISLLSN